MTGVDLSDDKHLILAAVSRFIEQRVRPNMPTLEQAGLLA